MVCCMPGPDVLRLRRLVFSAILCTIVDLNESPSKTTRVRHFYILLGFSIFLCRYSQRDYFPNISLTQKLRCIKQSFGTNLEDKKFHRKTKRILCDLDTFVKCQLMANDMLRPWSSGIILKLQLYSYSAYFFKGDDSCHLWRVTP